MQAEAVAQARERFAPGEMGFTFGKRPRTVSAEESKRGNVQPGGVFLRAAPSLLSCGTGDVVKAQTREFRQCFAQIYSVGRFRMWCVRGAWNTSTGWHGGVGEEEEIWRRLGQKWVGSFGTLLRGFTLLGPVRSAFSGLGKEGGSRDTERRSRNQLRGERPRRGAESLWQRPPDTFTHLCGAGDSAGEVYPQMGLHRRTTQMWQLDQPQSAHLSSKIASRGSPRLITWYIGPQMEPPAAWPARGSKLLQIAGINWARRSLPRRVTGMGAALPRNGRTARPKPSACCGTDCIGSAGLLPI